MRSCLASTSSFNCSRGQCAPFLSGKFSCWCWACRIVKCVELKGASLRVNRSIASCISSITFNKPDSACLYLQICQCPEQPAGELRQRWLVSHKLPTLILLHLDPAFGATNRVQFRAFSPTTTAQELRLASTENRTQLFSHFFLVSPFSLRLLFSPVPPRLRPFTEYRMGKLPLGDKRSDQCD